jgi:glycyl-tRNA synthetase alpha chain
MVSPNPVPPKRRAISVTERVGVIARVRQLAVGLAKAYLGQQTPQKAEVA